MAIARKRSLVFITVVCMTDDKSSGGQHKDAVTVVEEGRRHESCDCCSTLPVVRYRIEVPWCNGFP